MRKKIRYEIFGWAGYVFVELSFAKNMPQSIKNFLYVNGCRLYGLQEKKKNKGKKIKERNWIAVAAHFRSGAGTHKDKKKESSKKACRKKPKEDSD